jgi:hypothetical protein
VLLKVYAKCVDGQDEVARRRVEQALGHLGRARSVGWVTTVANGLPDRNATMVR